MFLHEVDWHIDRAAGISASVDILHSLRRARVDDRDESLRLELGDHRIEIDERGDLAALHDGNGARRRAGADNRDVIRFEADFCQKNVDEHVGRWSWRRY